VNASNVRQEDVPDSPVLTSAPDATALEYMDTLLKITRSVSCMATEAEAVILPVHVPYPYQAPRKVENLCKVDFICVEQWAEEEMLSLITFWQWINHICIHLTQNWSCNVLSGGLPLYHGRWLHDSQSTLNVIHFVFFIHQKLMLGHHMPLCTTAIGAHFVGSYVIRCGVPCVGNRQLLK